jgi:aspartate dehydrogenase
MRGWRIGLLGFGAIGRDVLSQLGVRHADAQFVVLRRNGDSIDVPNTRQVRTIEALVATRPDVVIEAAGHQALEASVPVLLKSGISVIAASVGSLVQPDDRGVLGDVLQVMAAPGARLVIPAGAIGGLDYIGAVALLPDLRIAYTSRKPPEAWADELASRGLEPALLQSELVLFEGSVSEAAARYPRNLNVAATIALAAGRSDVVSVRVVVDPAARGNTHEIACESSAGSARFEFINAPAPANPKTSMVTALSLVHCVEQYLAGMRRD